jgi:cystathionine beta-lyase/cystathionine gamma-synthase
LSRRLAELEGAESALVLASGMAATACTMLALLRSGDHLLASTWLRPDTRRFCERALPALGVTVSFVDPRETRGWRRALTRTTRVLFAESPVLTSTRLVDLKPPRTLALELGFALIVDSSAATPMNFQPLRHGADVVVHDARHLLAANAEGEVGVVCGTESLIDEVRAIRTLVGAVPHPAAMASLDRGLDTLDVRVRRQNENAREVAEWARQSAAVAEVHYPGLATHPDHELARDVQSGAGNIVVLDLHEAERARFACAPATAADAAGRATLSTVIVPGDSPTSVRVHVGIESASAVIDWLSARLP